MRSTPSSRTTSTSSISSTSSLKDLSDTARTILNSMCNERDFAAATAHISPWVVVQHEDNPPVASRDAYFSRWSRQLETMPNFQLSIKEACVDEAQRKVWVRSEITGLPNGMKKESIDMMTFDEAGLLSSTIDCQRTIRRRRNDD